MSKYVVGRGGGGGGGDGGKVIFIIDMHYCIIIEVIHTKLML